MRVSTVEFFIISINDISSNPELHMHFHSVTKFSKKEDCLN